MNIRRSVDLLNLKKISTTFSKIDKTSNCSWQICSEWWTSEKLTHLINWNLCGCYSHVLLFSSRRKPRVKNTQQIYNDRYKKVEGRWLKISRHQFVIFCFDQKLFLIRSKKLTHLPIWPEPCPLWTKKGKILIS